MKSPTETGATYVYLSGPMSNIPEYNFPLFKGAARDLRVSGYSVLSPAELDEAEGVTPSPGGVAPDPKDYARYLARDIQLIAQRGINGIVVLPGWRNSRGARTEVQFCRALGLPVLRYPDMSEVGESRLAALIERWMVR